MSKRRNKNKKAGPVTIIRPADLLASAIEEAPAVGEAAAPAEEQSVDLSAMLTVPDIAGDDTDAHENSASADLSTEGLAASEEQSSASVEIESHGEATPAESVSEETAAHGEPLHEFEDASALLAQTISVDPVDVPAPAQLESITIVDPSVGASDAIDAAPAESEQPPAVEPGEASAGGANRKSRKDRKLKLNKLQKHARSAPEPEPEVVAPEPEPEPVPRAPREPREPRIAAFAKLTEYQNLSLAHVPGLPEEADVAGHWRGVGFGISGRRLVTAFDEVVEIIRVPQITHVPGTQPWMLGVANVRGTLLPVVDLKQFLEGERTVMHEGQRVLVVRQAGGNVAVLIDQLFGQRTFNDTQKTAVEADDSTRYGHFVKQGYRVGDSDWGVFSMSMLTRTPEFRQAAA